MDEESSYASVGKKDVLRDTTDDLVIESQAIGSFNPSYASTIGHQEVVISRDDTELFHSPTNVNSVYATQNTSMTDNRSSPKELTLTDQTNFLPFRKIISVFCGLAVCILVSTLDATLVATSVASISAEFHAGKETREDLLQC